MTHGLLVLVSDRVSAWVEKGEVTDRYFNPGLVFDRVDLVMTNDDRPPADPLRRMAGGVEVTVHNAPSGYGTFLRTFGWRPSLLRAWARPVVDLARVVRPTVVRSYGLRLNAFAGSAVKDALGTPFAVSIHANPDLDEVRGRRGRTPAHRAAGRLAESVERHALHRADAILPVYESIAPYLERIGVPFEVSYNVVGSTATVKTSWATPGRAFRAICVGRQEVGEKDPRPIVEAVKRLPHVELTLVGDGPLHDTLVNLVRLLGVSDRVRLHRSMPNEEVLRSMAASDAFVYCTEMAELSKGTMEAALTGLPIVINDRPIQDVPELRGEHVLVTDGSADGYEAALRRLSGDETLRRRLGESALSVATGRWAPAMAEERHASIYRRLISSSPVSSSR